MAPPGGASNFTLGGYEESPAAHHKTSPPVKKQEPEIATSLTHATETKIVPPKNQSMY